MGIIVQKLWQRILLRIAVRICLKKEGDQEKKVNEAETDKDRPEEEGQAQTEPKKKEEGGEANEIKVKDERSKIEGTTGEILDQNKQGMFY